MNKHILRNKKNKTKEEKSSLSKLCRTINKKIKKNIKDRRIKLISKYLKETGGVKKAYKKIDKTKHLMTQLTDNLGNTVTNRMELMKIATKFYEDLYTKHNNTSQSFTTVTYNTDSVPPFMESEIEISIRNLKTGKSPGPDKVTNEMIKAGKDQLIKPLTKLFNLILYRKEIPKSWTLSEIVLLYKKGDPKMISNYRPISLISCIYKVFASTLLRRITKPIDENQPIEQAGFMRKYSTIDHIHTLKIIMEKYTEYDLPLYIAFIDYSKAFDSISHSSIWKALTEQGIEYEYIDLIKARYIY